MDTSSAIKYDLSWGDSHLVRDVMLERIESDCLLQGIPEHEFFVTARSGGGGYVGSERLKKLEDNVRVFLKENTGKYPTYVTITAGAQAALFVAAKALRDEIGSEAGIVYDKPYYIGLSYIEKELGFGGENVWNADKNVRIIVSPNNPTGNISLASNTKYRENTIWDGCYHNKIYTSHWAPYLERPDHIVSVGSIGKITGMNGLRLGWIATEDAVLFRKMTDIHYNLTLGVNNIAAATVNNIFQYVNLDRFYEESRRRLDDNRETLGGLKRIFGSLPPRYGMFWLVELDKHSRKLLEDSGIGFLDGESIGVPGKGRLSCGHLREVTAAAVKEVLKRDGKR